MIELYKEFRSDGFPLCPVCEEDKLYSGVMMAWMGTGERPTIEQCIAGEMTCYQCNWSSWKTLNKEKISALKNLVGAMEHPERN